MINELDAWNSFLATGSVLDYLQYKAIQNAQSTNNANDVPEDIDEICDGRPDNQRAEYR